MAFRKALLIVVIYFLNWNVHSQSYGDTLLYSECTFLTTHNAYNSKEKRCKLPNQYVGISGQLKLGVRAFMLDVYIKDTTIYCYHGVSFLGKQKLVDILLEIKQFLTDNPKEIVSLIFESYLENDALIRLFERLELNQLTYQKKREWETLEIMRAKNQRLVVFSDQYENGFQNCIYMWDEMVETHYGIKSKKKLTNIYNRGLSTNNLVIFNHFLTKRVLGVGSKRKARKINNNEYLIERLLSFENEKGRHINFLTIDFIENDLLVPLTNKK